jgi:hypothetical protein
VDGANAHDTGLAAPTLDGIVIARKTPSEDAPQHLCLDAAYVGEKTEQVVKHHKYIAHIRPRSEERVQAQSADPEKPAASMGRRTASLLAQPFTQDPGPLGETQRNV